MQNTETTRAASLLVAIGVGLFGCGDNLTHRAGFGEDSGVFECLPNLDGQVEGDELPVAFGVSTAYLVSPSGAEQQVDVAGSVDDTGRLAWNWTSSTAGDETVLFAPTAITERWYDAQFSDGEFAVPLDASGTVEAVYRRDDTALWLLGMASAQSDPAEGQTLIVYDEPVVLYSLPIELDAQWSSVGTYSNGLLRGQPIAGQDEYTGVVDALGQMHLPGVTFAYAHRVRLDVTAQTIVGDPVTQRQISFVSECFGEVARATSRLGEGEPDFQVATEVRRFTFGAQ